MFFSRNCHNWRDSPLPRRLRKMPPLEIPSSHPPARLLAFLATVLLALGSVVTALPARAQDASDQQRCLGETAVSLDKRIEACTALIGKPGTPKAELVGFYIARGNAQRGKKQLDAAIEDYSQALKLDGAHVEALNRRGLAYAEKGDRERAFADFDRAVHANPKHAESYNNRGAVWRD